MTAGVIFYDHITPMQDEIQHNSHPSPEIPQQSHLNRVMLPLAPGPKQPHLN